MGIENNSLEYVLVIPALNEAAAIGATLRAALAAREKVLAKTPVTAMHVVFVNDGSTDETQNVVDQAEFEEVVKVRFPANRGYGAAIKAGWRACEGELVGHMDADGTCDPAFSVELINHLMQKNADVVLGGRMNDQSEMPLVRKIGNWIFARLLGAISGKSVTDVASGFRIIKRSRLGLMSPLPDGLHFTPSMSCACLLDPRLKIEEVPMPYRERVGRSKLSVVRDGINFLFTIIFSACCYTPLKTMIGAAALLLVLTSLLVAVVSALGGSTGISEWLVLAAVLASVTFVWSGAILHQLNFLLIGPVRESNWVESALQRTLNVKRLIVGGAATALVSAASVIAVNMSDSLSAAATHFLNLILLVVAVGGAEAFVTGLIVRVIWCVGRRQDALIRDAYKVKTLSVQALPDRKRRAKVRAGADLPSVTEGQFIRSPK